MNATTRVNLSVLVVLTLAGCVPSASNPKRIRDSTVREIYDTWNAARCERDWELWFDCMTPQAREGEIPELLLQSGFARGKATKRLGTLEGEQRKQLQQWINQLARLLESQKTNARFTVNLKNHLDSPVAGFEAKKCDPSKRKLENVQRTGDKAKARCTHPGYAPDLMWFRRVDGKWRVDFEL